jgi:hypothetical protein
MVAAATCGLTQSSPESLIGLVLNNSLRQWVGYFELTVECSVQNVLNGRMRRQKVSALFEGPSG